MSQRVHYSDVPIACLSYLSLSLQLYVDRSGQSTEILLAPVYLPLNPHECMCNSMEAVAEDIDLLFDSSCNITDEGCTELQCAVDESPVQRLTMNLSQCDTPPTLNFEIVAQDTTYTAPVTGNTTKSLASIGVTVAFTVWYYEYSMDLQVQCMYTV